MGKQRSAQCNQLQLRHQNRKPAKGKRNQQTVVNDRWGEKYEQGKQVSEKHHMSRLQFVLDNPIKPMNSKQAIYLNNLRTKPYNVATGYAGSSKTYLATRVAIEEFLKGNIDKIVIARPAVSDSKSLGFFGGSKEEKVRNWILPVLEVLEEFLGASYVDYLIAKGVIEGVPLETIKGRSFKNCFIICDEAEDLKKSEVIKCITRLGTGSTIVFAGDVRQVDIKESGLKFVIEDLVERDTLKGLWGFVDFDQYDEIVRSVAVKKTIIELSKMGEM